MFPDVLVHHLKRAQFQHIVGPERWQREAPLFFQAIANEGEFTVLVVMRCGCAMPVFYKTAKIVMADGTKNEALTCSFATPMDWDEQCPSAFLPESAAEKPVFQISIPWGHSSMMIAVDRYEANAAASVAAHKAARKPDPIK